MGLLKVFFKVARCHSAKQMCARLPVQCDFERCVLCVSFCYYVINDQASRGAR